MTQSITSCTISEVPERLCSSPMDTIKVSPYTSKLQNPTTDICKIEYTQFGEVYVCMVCNVRCTGKAPFSQHISGSHHRRNCNNNAFFCNECNANLNSPEQYSLHCRGSKHKRNTLLSSDNSVSEQPGVEHHFNKNNDSPYFCTPCGLICSSKEQLDSHFSGKKHKKQCRKHKAFALNQSPEYVVSAQSNQPIDQPDIFSSMPVLLSSVVENPANLYFPKMVPCIRNIMELETKLSSSNNFSPFITSLAPCSYQQKSDISGSVSPSHQNNCSPSEFKRFCKHSECVLMRSAQFYENSLIARIGNP
ncbi:zinc C2H2 type [Schistosoma japonicum]|uniref:Zinc C2H2 type n=1 Tax=Schistosoma japonicum TaxID=6182 RepID=A0A4Z2CMS6_SCHJA|nr:zinc C2H2 type [Schistosoma japonicum]